MLVTAPHTADTQHSTTTNEFGSGDILASVLMMFAFYAVVLVIATVISIESWKAGWRRKVEHWLDRELHMIEKMGLWFLNRYWLVRCMFLKRWWQNRSYYKSSELSFGMSWEGKEKEYSQRYAQVK